MFASSLSATERYLDVRQRSLSLCAPLATEDFIPQPCQDVSPPKWHLAHTTWFFEALILQAHQPGYRIFHPRFAYLFNSYYETQGERVLRAERGNLSRPTVAEIDAYRQHVDLAMQELLHHPLHHELAALIELGLQHEQQHQELLLTDIKFILGTQALTPAYATTEADLYTVRDEHCPISASTTTWLRCDGGVREIGHTGAPFAFDNEMPQHAVYIAPCEVRNALVSHAEYLDFMRDGGYQRFEFWHAEGWDWVSAQAQAAPLYWHADPAQPDNWLHYTLGGMQPLALNSPVTHINYYEAYAFCQWAGWRLPTEFEWEALSSQLDWGQRWEWTESAYLPYPGFRKSAGAVGEYNGKFMVNQKVLRGASYATPAGHARNTYRNFFHPHLRWQYTGIRPARDLSCSD